MHRCGQRGVGRHDQHGCIVQKCSIERREQRIVKCDVLAHILLND